MRVSRLFFPTLREIPADAELISHKLLLRGGFMRKVAAGVYSFLPLGWRVIKKIEGIVREEMDAAGGQELLLPAIHPKVLWEQTGRWDLFGPVMFRIIDNRQTSDYVLGPTHEAVITDLVRNEVKSYRDLPLLLYQIQTKFRDEIRARGGLIRCREFIMKDLYSFDRDEFGLDLSYGKIKDAYCRIFDRIGIPYKMVEAPGGAIGGSDTIEFMVPSPSGEDRILVCDSCGYAANLEVASIGERGSESLGEESTLRKVSTPAMKTVEEVSRFLGVKPSDIVKTLIYIADGEPVAVLIRGDRELNEWKLSKILGASNISMADGPTVERITGCPVGFAGPVGLKGIRIVSDKEVSLMRGFVTGANEADAHLLGVCPGRDFKIDLVGEIRNAADGDPCPRCNEGRYRLENAIEIAHIFKLGTIYSEKMRATFMDEDGSEKYILMGCYGLGVSRLMAAVVEVSHDENGIIWPLSISPYQIIITSVNPSEELQKDMAEEIYEILLSEGAEVLYDDRDLRPGVKFKDADLIGIPIQVVVGIKAREGKVEVRLRKDKGRSKDVGKDEILGVVRDFMAELGGIDGLGRII